MDAGETAVARSCTASDAFPELMREGSTDEYGSTPPPPSYQQYQLPRPVLNSTAPRHSRRRVDDLSSTTGVKPHALSRGKDTLPAPCMQFLTRGRCSYGTRCKFSHEPESIVKYVDTDGVGGETAELTPTLFCSTDLYRNGNGESVASGLETATRHCRPPREDYPDPEIDLQAPLYVLALVGHISQN